MRQIKIFKSLEYEYADLEHRVNTWISENQINVVDIKLQLESQTTPPGKETSFGHAADQSDLMLVVIYEA